MFELLAKHANRALNRPSGRIPQPAERPAVDLRADIQQQVDVARLACPPTNAVEHLNQPPRPLATGRTLAARLPRVELRRSPNERHDASVLIEEHAPAGANHRLNVRHLFIAENCALSAFSVEDRYRASSLPVLFGKSDEVLKTLVLKDLWNQLINAENNYEKIDYVDLRYKNKVFIGKRKIELANR